MFTRRAVTTSSLALLAGCATGTSATPEAPRGRAAIGSFGIDLTAVDPSVKPGDDFFQYVNGRWLNDPANAIPADRTSWGTNVILSEKAERDVRAIIEEAAASSGASGSNQQKIADYFNSYVDQDTIDGRGLAPLQPVLTQIAALRTHEDVMRLIALPEVGISAPIDVNVTLDEGNPDRYVVGVTHGGLGLPEREYYRRTDGEFPNIRTQYVAAVAQMLGLAGVTDTEAKAQRILAFETQIAERHWPIADRRERERVYNLMDRAGLRAIAPNFPWDARLDAAGLQGADAIVVAELSAMRPLAELCLATPVSTWKDYITWHYVRGWANVLPRAIDDANFAFYGRTLNGQPQQRERWKRAIASINNVLGEAVGQIYVQRHFPPEAKTQALELVENMRRAYGERIRAVAWMSEETKIAALEKLATFRPKIGYPDVWKDYSRYEVRAGDAFGNSVRYAQWNWQHDVERLGKPSDRENGSWRRTPSTPITTRPSMRSSSRPAICSRRCSIRTLMRQ
jgi:putative endopeptidase